MPYGPGKPVRPWSGEWQDASVALGLCGVRVGVLEVSLESCQVKREVMWSCPGGNMESNRKDTRGRTLVLATPPRSADRTAAGSSGLPQHY